MPRVIKFNPKDPDWKFPYATRKRIEKLRPLHENGYKNVGTWKNQPVSYTSALPPKLAKELRKTTRWPSVPEQFRERVEEWFQKKLAQVKAERGVVTPGKLRSLRMNAAWMGRALWTYKKSFKARTVFTDKKMWRRYCEWEAEQQRKSMLPEKTPSKVLDIG